MAKTKTRKVRAAAHKQINAKDFHALLKQSKILKRRAGDANSELGGLISNASEHKFLDKTAFGIVRKLDAMETQKLSTVLSCLRLYIDYAGLDERIAGEPDLGLDNVVPMKIEHAAE